VRPVSNNVPNAAALPLLALFALEIDPQYQHALVEQVFFLYKKMKEPMRQEL
jgi:hypothetical protein